MACAARYEQMACVMARMCASLKERSNAEPRWPRRAEHDALGGDGGVRLLGVIGGHESRDIDQHRDAGAGRPASGLMVLIPAGLRECDRRQAFLRSRVIQTRITAPTNATMIEPIHYAARPESEHAEEPAPHEPPQYAEDDVDHDAVTAALHDLTREPAGDKPDDDPIQHGSSPWVQGVRPGLRQRNQTPIRPIIVLRLQAPCPIQDSARRAAPGMLYALRSSVCRPDLEPP